MFDTSAVPARRVTASSHLALDDVKAKAKAAPWPGEGLEPPPDRKLAAMIGRLEGGGAFATLQVRRIEACIDRLEGPPPPGDTAEGPDPAGSDGLASLSRIAGRYEQLGAVLETLADRLEGVT